MSKYHHAKLPDFSTLLAGNTPPNEIGFRSERLQIWYNRTDESWVGATGEIPHFHVESDECFIVLKGVLRITVEDEQFTVSAGEFCCFPAGVYHAILEVYPPVETVMIRAPSVNDKVYKSL